MLNDAVSAPGLRYECGTSALKRIESPRPSRCSSPATRAVLGVHRAIPTIKPVMTVVGAAYILWLAWKTITSSPHDDSATGRSSFLAGVLLQFLNPKGILYGIAVASTFLVPYYHSAPTLAAFAAALALLGIVSTILWALFGSIFRRFMAENHRAVGYVMGALLVYCAVSLFV